MARQTTSRKPATEVPQKKVSTGDLPSPAVGSPPSGITMVAETVHADNVKDLYCNFSKIAVSQWDFTLTVGQLVEKRDLKAVNEISAIVRFSPHYFKVTVQTLVSALEQWEATFGEITLGLGQSGAPGSMESAFDALKQALSAATAIKQP